MGPESQKLSRERQLMEQQQVEFERLREALSRATTTQEGRVRSYDLRATPESHEEVRAAAAALRKSSLSVMRLQEQYLKELQDYGKSVVSVITLLQNSAKECRAYAKDETYQDLKQRYLDQSVVYESLAKMYSDEAHSLARTKTRMEENLRYVRRTEVFLGRLESFAIAFPERRPNQDELVSELTTYVEQFERLRLALIKLYRETTGVEAGNR
ncbi:MAG: hypothetical protein KDA60_00800 [Planctomycetales bacterium]|nr:hypothetical protein [Planctomycetales bacterium]